MKLKTHLKIDQEMSGKVIELKENYAKVLLETKKFMAADEMGLVHGGFTFSAADFAAMAAVNEPNVVLAVANVKFLAPVVVGDEVIFEAKVIEPGKKAEVKVIGRVGERSVFQGDFFTYTPTNHILSMG